MSPVSQETLSSMDAYDNLAKAKYPLLIYLLVLVIDILMSVIDIVIMY